MNNPNVSLLAVAIVTAASSACISSVRPETLTSPVDPAQVSQGRKALDEAADKHGKAAYDRASSLQLSLHDKWQGFVATTFGNPWPDSEVSVDLAYRLRTFDARAQFTSGDDAGLVWGLQNWSTYQEKKGEARTFDDDDDQRFILPAIQYFIELPFRLQTAEHVVAAGEETVSGITYDRVFVTWGELEAHTEHDQYLLYINRETGLVDKVSFTVREAYRFVTGAMHYDNYVDVDGLKVSTRMTVTDEVTDDQEDFLHRMTVDPNSIKLDAIQQSEFVVQPELPASGDNKPS